MKFVQFYLLLFTDGLANAGLSRVDEITAAMENPLALIRAQTKNCSVFSFGFGADHDENMLRKIAETGNGMYYFIGDVDKIPVSFADCLGGLQSVVGQNLVLSVETKDPNLSILRSLNPKYKLQNNASLPTSNKIFIELGDIYSEEQRDMIFMVKLPKLDQENLNYQPLTFTLTYFNAMSTQDDVQKSEILIKRPGVVSNVQPNISLDIQRNRLLTADAMENGRKKKKKLIKEI